MLREKLMDKGIGMDKDFRLRGNEVSRLEAFSDAVFAFALALLIVSIEVPKTFDQLLITMRGFIAFGICFLLLFQIWHYHYTFFRRYGLQDTYIFALNAILLFVILFYVYPLKFLFSMLVDIFSGRNLNIILPDGTTQRIINRDQVWILIAIYSIGFTTVYFIFTLLYLHAYRKRISLELNELEIFDTRSSIISNMIMAFVGGLSIAIALTVEPRKAYWGGWIYFLIPIAFTIYGTINGKHRRKLKEKFNIT